MPKFRRISSSRSQDGSNTPRRRKSLGSRSIGSPATSNASGRLTAIIDQFQDKPMDSFTVSPMNRQSLLTDASTIDQPQRQSWWKNYNENSHDVMQLLEGDELQESSPLQVTNDIKNRSGNNSNSSLELPESSDNESIHSIILTQHKLFTQKEKKSHNKFAQIMGATEVVTEQQSNATFFEKSITLTTKNLFQGSKKSKSVFSAALPNICLNRTSIDTTVEDIAVEPKIITKSIFSSRPTNKRKNMFDDCIVPDSEHENSEIEIVAKERRIDENKNKGTANAIINDNESIHSIILSQHELSTQKEKKSHNKFAQIMGATEVVTEQQSNATFFEKSITITTKNLFQGSKKSKSVFSAALPNICLNRTSIDTTVEDIAEEPKIITKSIFSSRPTNKHKNMFDDYIVPDSEHENSEIEIVAKERRIDENKNKGTTNAIINENNKPNELSSELDSKKTIEVADDERKESIEVENDNEGQNVFDSVNTDKTRTMNNLSAQGDQEKMEVDVSKNDENLEIVDDEIEIQDDENKTDDDENKEPGLYSDESSINYEDSSVESEDNKGNDYENEENVYNDDESNKVIDGNNEVNAESDENVTENDENDTENDANVIVNDENGTENDDNVSENENVTENDANVIINDENDTENDENVSENDENVIVNHENVTVNDENDAEIDDNISENDNENVSENDENDTKNAENVTGNEENVSENDKIVSENDENVIVNDENVTVNDENDAEIDDNISENGDNTSENDENVSENDNENVSENHENDTKNAENVTGNEENVSENDKIVSENDENVIVNDENVTVNDENDAENDDNISENGDNTSENDENVSENDNENVSENDENDTKKAENVTGNEENVSENDKIVSGNDENVIVNDENVTVNDENDAEIDDNISENGDNTSENDENVSENDNENVSENDENDTKNAENVTGNEENVSENDKIVSENDENVIVNDENVSENDNENVTENDENDTKKAENVTGNEENVSENDKIVSESDENVIVNDENVTVNDENDAEIDDNISENGDNTSENDENVSENDNENVSENYENDTKNAENVTGNEENVSENDKIVSENDENVIVNDENVTVNDENDAEIDDNISENGDNTSENDENVSENDNENVSENDENDTKKAENVTGNEENVSENDKIVSENDENENKENERISVPNKEIIEQSPNVTHDTTGRKRKRMKSLEVARNDVTKNNLSFIAKKRNTSIGEAKSVCLAPPRDNIRLSAGDSSAEGSGWDSHRTTRKTLRQTFGKDFTPRKSLRALVMEKSAKQSMNRQTLPPETMIIPQANSTEFPRDSDVEDDVTIESDHEESRRERLESLKEHLQKMKKQNIEKKLKMEQAIRGSLKAPSTQESMSLFRVPSKPRPKLKLTTKKTKQCIKSTPFGEIPTELIEDMKYKPPKRFQPSNASWITKRLYKFLENKLEPKYNYKARVRAEKLVEGIYHFAKDVRRHDVAATQAVDALKLEFARLDIVKTHYEFYEFFHEFMPREIRIKVVPDLVNKIPLPRHGVFTDILRDNTASQETSHQ